MQVIHSKKLAAEPASPKINYLLDTISEKQLRAWVEKISVPRHYAVEAAQNCAIAAWLSSEFKSFNLRVESQGAYANILGLPQRRFSEAILIGAHYDSVPLCPGADDNGSAVAAMLGCAAACSLWKRPLPIVFVAFNREEDGLLGSRDFVENYLPATPFRIRAAHILEMVGFASSKPGSQMVPPGLPVKVSDKGDFLGLLANRDSAKIMHFVMCRAKAYAGELPVMGLKVHLGIERYFPVLQRSDHAPFWSKKIPALMWTDTSEFRNHNYHRDTDTPDTLDYKFLTQITRLLTASVILAAEKL